MLLITAIGGAMLRMRGEQPETLWDEILPPSLRELPEDLKRLDVLLDDPALLRPVRNFWCETAPGALENGRPTMPMETYLRLMLVKQRYGWGYETLLREVSDSLHLRRFCRIALDRELPDESTVRRMTRRLGEEVVREITRVVIAKAQRETRFQARAARIDSTVIEADIRYPTDSGLALDGAAALAREGQRLARASGGARTVRDRTRGIGRTIRGLGRALARRTGTAKAEVLEQTGRCGQALEQSIRETRRAIAAARRSARGRGARAKLAAATRAEQTVEHCQRVADQIRRRLAGQPISDRLVSLADRDARPIRKGKLGQQTEFGYVAQITELCPSTRRGARGLILPIAIQPGARAEHDLLPHTVGELQRGGLRPQIVCVDGGFHTNATHDTLKPLAPRRIYIAGRSRDAARSTRRRLAGFRTGTEGRISHLKRGYGLRRSKLRGLAGANTHTNWSILAYDLDTYLRYSD